MIILSAYFQAKPGQEAALETALRGMIPHVQQEPGAITYALHRSHETAGHFFFFERYADQDALDAHMAKPYLRSLLDEVAPLLAKPVGVETFTEIAAIAR